MTTTQQEEMEKRFDEFKAGLNQVYPLQHRSPHPQYELDILAFLQSEIDRAVAERDREVVGMIEKMNKPPEEEKFTEDKFENTENMNRVFMRVGYRKALNE